MRYDTNPARLALPSCETVSETRIRNINAAVSDKLRNTQRNQNRMNSENDFDTAMEIKTIAARSH